MVSLYIYPQPNNVSTLQISLAELFLHIFFWQEAHDQAMAEVENQDPAAEAPALPDYMLDPNAVLGDNSAEWRYGRAPDYSNTRNVYEQSMYIYFQVVLFGTFYYSAITTVIFTFF